jgi:hypothetical protein
VVKSPIWTIATFQFAALREIELLAVASSCYLCPKVAALLSGDLQIFTTFFSGLYPLS